MECKTTKRITFSALTLNKIIIFRKITSQSLNLHFPYTGNYIMIRNVGGFFLTFEMHCGIKPFCLVNSGMMSLAERLPSKYQFQHHSTRLCAWKNFKGKESKANATQRW